MSYDEEEEVGMGFKVNSDDDGGELIDPGEVPEMPPDFTGDDGDDPEDRFH